MLAMKKRGFGVGKWNGVGGKIKSDEPILSAAIREINEEIGVTVSVGDLMPMGEITFSFADNAGWDNHMHIFCIKNWKGEPAESEEMRPRWFDINKLPFGEMWVDDPHWLPDVLKGKKINGQFSFNTKGDAIVTFAVRAV